MPDYDQVPESFRSAIFETIRTKAPYWSLLGMELLDIRKGWARVRLPFSEKLLQPYGVAHGGAVFSPADSAVAMAFIGMVDRDEVFTTIEMKIHYLKPFTGGDLIAEASIIHKGSKIVLGDVEVRNGNGDLVAKGLATYLIMKKE